MTQPRTTTVDNDPNNPYITMVAAPSQVLPLAEMSRLMEAHRSFDHNPAMAQAVANRVMALIKIVTNRETGLAELIPDDLWADDTLYDLYGLPPAPHGGGYSRPYTEMAPGYMRGTMTDMATAEGWTDLEWTVVQ